MKSFYLFFVTVVGVAFLSSSSQAQWTPSTVTTNYNVISLVTTSSSIYGGTYQHGVYSSAIPSPSSWTADNTGAMGSTFSVYALAVNQSDVYAGVQGSAGGVFISASGGNWTHSLTANIYSLLVKSPSDIYAGGLNSGSGTAIFHYNGTSWDTSTTIGSGSQYVSAISLGPGGYLYVGTAGGGMWYSRNSDTSWTTASDSNLTSSATVYSLAYDGTYLFAGTNSGLYYSTNGTSWTKSSAIPNAAVWALYLTSNNYVLAGVASNGLYIAGGQSNNWSKFSTQASNFSTSTIRSITDDGTYVYVGCNDGTVSYLTDTSLPVQATGFKAAMVSAGVRLSWKTQSEVGSAGFNVYRKDAGAGSYRLIASYVNDDSLRGMGNSTAGRSYDYVDNKVQAGLTYDYMIQSVSTSGKATQVGVITVTVTVPDRFSLSQNYPNPFNPSTSVDFELPVSSSVTLDIYNVLGQKVEGFSYGLMNPGRYHENIDLDKFSSGVYLYRLDATGAGGRNFVSVKKMILMK